MEKREEAIKHIELINTFRHFCMKLKCKYHPKHQKLMLQELYDKTDMNLFHRLEDAFNFAYSNELILKRFHFQYVKVETEFKKKQILKLMFNNLYSVGKIEGLLREQFNYPNKLLDVKNNHVIINL